MEKKHIYYGLGAIALVGLAIWAFKEKNESPTEDSNEKAPPAKDPNVKPTQTSGISGRKGYIETGFDGNKVFVQPMNFPNYDYVGWYGANGGGYYGMNGAVPSYYGANAGYYGVSGKGRKFKRVYANEALREIPKRTLGENKMWCCSERDTNGNCTQWEQRDTGSPCDNNA
ncbi:MAG TPA: hypothetical protein VN026_13610 [Bacteroidia bacterium]|jgi:hypothetical protein|nr:hypothetical protein [Bacteroidia bacterium]